MSRPRASTSRCGGIAFALLSSVCTDTLDLPIMGKQDSWRPSWIYSFRVSVLLKKVVLQVKIPSFFFFTKSVGVREQRIDPLAIKKAWKRVEIMYEETQLATAEPQINAAVISGKNSRFHLYLFSCGLRH